MVLTLLEIVYISILEALSRTVIYKLVLFNLLFLKFILTPNSFTPLTFTDKQKQNKKQKY